MISFPAEFAVRRGGAGALFARARFSAGELLALTGKTRFTDSSAYAAGAFGAPLATIGFAFVGVTFTRPIVLDHSATRASRFQSRRRFSVTDTVRLLDY
jgi:hypothetical protein